MTAVTINLIEIAPKTLRINDLSLLLIPLRTNNNSNTKPINTIAHPTIQAEQTDRDIRSKKVRANMAKGKTTDPIMKKLTIFEDFVICPI